MIQGKGSTSFNVIGYLYITFFALVCLYPFVLIIVGSFTSERAIITEGYSLFPKEWSLEAYRTIFKQPDTVLQAYSISMFVTVVGTTLSMLVVSMGSYVLSRQDFGARNGLSLFFYFTMIFGGGLVPTYILIARYLRMKNSIWVLIIPMLLNVWYLFLLRNYMRSIPASVIESARIDGANDWRIYWQMILPMSLPGLATIGLFTGLGYWNNWVAARLYIETPKLYPLQYVLFEMLNSARYREMMATTAETAMADLPTQSLKLAMAVIATGPMILLFPFLQKYFVKGLTMGAVKG
jgi:putative aldouronate transport system permease protein